MTGKPPVGWYYGRLSARSKALIWDVYNELKLPLMWQSDSYSDDLPYWVDVPAEQALHKEGKLGKPEGMLMVP